MIYQTFSPKQIQAMLWWAMPKFRQYDAIICDGSVRSGKTMAMSIGYLLWSMRSFDHETFAFCGKTIDSLKRNVVTPIQKWMAGVMQPKINLSKNYMDVEWRGHHNRYYFFGGKDESSYALIQGITLAGVLLDEVALMPRSFVDQATARCSVTGSKIWMNCNPDGSEEHWLYKEWIDSVHGKAGEKNRLHLHFTMEDNRALSVSVRKRYERMYSGVFYDRYVLGKWVMADGLVYPQFQKLRHVIPDTVPDVHSGEFYLSCDYGTLNPTSVGLWHLSGDGYATRIREYYYDARKEGHSRTDEEHYAALEQLAGDIAPYVRYVIVDPSAASFIECIRRHGVFRVRKANNSVLDGIRDTSTLLQAGRIHICEGCTDIIREFGLYCWDNQAKGKDAVVKTNDHAMDDMRYFVRTAMQRTLREYRMPPADALPAQRRHDTADAAVGGIISEPCRLDPEPHPFLSHSGEYRTGAETADTDGIFRHGTRCGRTGTGGQPCAAEAAAENGLRACHWRLAAKTLFHGTGRFGGHCAAERLSPGELHGRFL